MKLWIDFFKIEEWKSEMLKLFDWQTRDSAFEEVELRFNELVRLVQTTLRDITSVSEQLKATSQTQFNISEAVASFYGESSRLPVIDNFRTAQRMIFTQHWSAFVSNTSADIYIEIIIFG